MSDGWIEWAGGERPVQPDTKVQVELRNGSRDGIRSAQAYRWSCNGNGFDIVRYRIVRPPLDFHTSGAPVDPLSDPIETQTFGPLEPADVSATLAERGSRYGPFDSHAEITQSLKRAMQATAGWQRLVDDQRESLEMVAHKIGRILNGDPNYDDSWHDIAGYAQLVADRLRKEQA